MTKAALTLAVLLLAILPEPVRITGGSSTSPASFVSAKPVWLEGRETDRNLFVGFRASFEAASDASAILRVTASTVYRAFVNGRFLGYGPARAAHGYFRVDEWDLRGRLAPGRNVVAIEVAGYNVNSYYLLNQPSFLQAEVVAGREVLASTSGRGVPFEAAVLQHRVRKVQRYSFQRPFIEVYRLGPGADSWRAAGDTAFAGEKLAAGTARQLLSRRVPYPSFAERPALAEAGGGKVAATPLPEKPWRDRALTQIGPKLGGFPEGELDEIVSLDLQKLRSTVVQTAGSPLAADAVVRVEPGSWRVVDFGTNLTGFIGARISCTEKSRVYVVFDELLTAGDVDFKRLGCVNAVTYELLPGEYQVESFEPYTLRYLKLIALDGACEFSRLRLREYANSEADRAVFRSDDADLNRIFKAARETFRQNAVDLFMDCPSRERAGWLCDSFFASRVALDLCGTVSVETAFLENFALPSSFADMPDGMLPMCYPADHNDGVFIPNWAMWFVVQLEEYAARGGDRNLVERLQPRVMKLLEYLGAFRNPDGLLEKLPSWVFVEWSKANSFTQDVNYPSNMLYAGALDAAGRLYGREDLRREAEHVRRQVRKQSFDGEFFVDNAVRRDGKLEPTRNRTEVCQYYAFFFDVARPERDRELWYRLESAFGPRQKGSSRFPEIHPANAFIGNYLRLELLSRYGRTEQLVQEIKGYFLKMADRTGTLWENDDTSASCNHGFASHVAHVLLRDVLGLRSVDPVRGRFTVLMPNISVARCEGHVPLGEGYVDLKWRRTGQAIRYLLTGPGGYRPTIRQTPGLDVLVDRP